MKGGTQLGKDDIPLNIPDKLTKRMVLSQINSVFDPLGLISPFTVKAKILLKDLWRRKFDWDDEIIGDVKEHIISFFKEMFELEMLSFRRCLKPVNSVEDPDLVTFSDASTDAFGACSYLRWKLIDGTYTSVLVAAKNRVSPLKVLSIVRLELSAAVIAKRLAEFLEKETRFKIKQRYFFVDSKVVKSMICKESHAFNTFVAVKRREEKRREDNFILIYVLNRKLKIFINMNAQEAVCSALTEAPEGKPLYGDPVKIVNGKEIPLLSESNSSSSEKSKASDLDDQQMKTDLDHKGNETTNPIMTDIHGPELDQEIDLSTLGSKVAKNMSGTETIPQRFLRMMAPSTSLFHFNNRIKETNTALPLIDRKPLDMTEVPQISDQFAQELNSKISDNNLEISDDDDDYPESNDCAGKGLFEGNHINELYNEPVMCKPENIKLKCKDPGLLARAFNKLLTGKKIRSFICPRTMHDHDDCIGVLTKHISSLRELINMVKELKGSVNSEQYKMLLPYFQYFNPRDIRSMVSIYSEITRGYGDEVSVHTVVLDLLESTFNGYSSSEMLTLSLCLFPAFTYKESEWLYSQLTKMSGEPVLLSTSTLARCLLYLFKIGKLIDMPPIMQRIGKTETHPVLQLPSDLYTLYAPSWSEDISLETCYKITALIGIPGYEKTYERLEGKTNFVEFIDTTYDSAIGVSNLLQDAKEPRNLITNNRQRDACASCASPIGTFCTCTNCGTIRLISNDGSNRPACTAHTNILSKEKIRELSSGFLSEDLIGPVLIANNINTVSQIKAVENAINDYTHEGITGNFRLLLDSLKATKEMEMCLENLHGTFQSSLSQLTNHINSERSCIEASTKATQEMTIAVSHNTQAISTIRPLSITSNTAVIKEVIEFLTRDFRKPGLMITDDIIKSVVSKDEDILIALCLSSDELEEE